jgi:hypothetical protein
MSSSWYLQTIWDEERHREFYEHYRNADALAQEKALISQAELLTKHLDEVTLKAAESLLILWMSNNFNSSSAPRVYGLLHDIYNRIGDHERAKEFAHKLKQLRP